MTPPPPNVSSGDATPAPLPPPRVPDHELIRRIGRGAYGEVWLARSVTGAYRAVKIVHRRSFDHDRPFEREFEGILKFEPISRRHESQVDILHVGRGDDCFYYVMELADDQTTGGRIDPDAYAPRTLKSDLMFHGRLPFEECVRIGIALATALEHLHGNGLVHRDVKPSNIIFVNGVPKLADIGLVTGVDATRSYVGTEGFAAPEGPGTAQADLYSLGKVLYEAATGKDRQEFPELPTQLRELPDRDGLMELNAVIAKACRHDPKDRYASSAVMRADLELLQSGESLARLRRTEARLRFVQRAGALATTLAALIAAGWLWQARQTRAVRELAGEKNRLVEEKSRLAEESRQRLLQLHAANGLREMEAGDLGEAMLWFMEAARATNDPVRSEMHRRQLSMLLQMHPKPLSILPVADATTGELPNGLQVSRNGRRMLVNWPARVALWEIGLSCRKLVEIPDVPRGGTRVLAPDGRRFIVSSPDRALQQIWTVDSTNGATTIPLKSGPLRHIQFAGGSARVIGVNSDQVLVEVDADRGVITRNLAAFETTTAGLSVMDNGRRLAVELSNRIARVIDLATGEKVGEIALPKGQRLGVIADQHGRLLVSLPPFSQLPGEYRGHIWDISSGRVIGRPIVHETTFEGCFGSWDGRLLATGAWDGTVQVWNQFTGDPVTPPLASGDAILGLAFSPDNTRVAAINAGGVARIWDARTGQPVTPPLLHGGMGYGLDFALGGAALITLANDGLLRVWNLASSDASSRRLEVPGEFRRAGFSPNGDLFFAHCNAETRLWHARDWHVVGSIEHRSGRARDAVFHPDSRHLAVLPFQGEVQVWDTRSLAPAGPPIRHGTNVIMSLKFSPDGKLLATGATDHTVRFWDWKTGREVASPLSHSGAVMVVDFSPKGDRLFSVNNHQGKIQGTLWNWKRHEILYQGDAREAAGSDWVWDFSPDGTKLAVQGSKDEVALLDAETGKALGPSLRGERRVMSLQFHPNGRHVLTGWYDGKARIWDAESRRVTGATIRHGAGPLLAHYPPDGSLILTRTQEGQMRFWDASSGMPLTGTLPFQASHSQYRPLAFHPDGRRLAVATIDRQMVIQDFRSDLPVELLEDMVRWTTSRKLDAKGEVQFLSVDEWLKVQERLRPEISRDTAAIEEWLASWHKQQIAELGPLHTVEPSLFHLDQLRVRKPEGAVLRVSRDSLVAKRVAARDPAIPSRLLDLTDHYTDVPATLPNNDLANLPLGLVRLADTDWDIRGLVMLGHAYRFHPADAGRPSRISFIRVAQRCNKLQFLQATDGDGGVDGTEVARFNVRYADGSLRAVPLVYGRHLRNWWRFDASGRPASNAVVAWEGQGDLASRRGATVRLFKSTWDNPNPAVEITHLELEIGPSVVHPLVVAITAE